MNKRPTTLIWPLVLVLLLAALPQSLAERSSSNHIRSSKDRTSYLLPSAFSTRRLSFADRTSANYIPDDDKVDDSVNNDDASSDDNDDTTTSSSTTTAQQSQSSTAAPYSTTSSAVSRAFLTDNDDEIATGDDDTTADGDDEYDDDEYGDDEYGGDDDDDDSSTAPVSQDTAAPVGFNYTSVVEDPQQDEQNATSSSLLPDEPEPSLAWPLYVSVSFCALAVGFVVATCCQRQRQNRRAQYELIP